MTENNEIKKVLSYKRAFNIKDTYYTPLYLVSCLKPYIDLFMQKINKAEYKDLTIYCPFDTVDSEYVRYFMSLGCNVIYGDITTGQDFFNTPIEKNIDVVISNIPFSHKLKIFDKLIRADVPFCLLCNMMAVNYQEVGNFFHIVETEKKEPIQFLIPDKKVSFDGRTSAFCSGYYCYRFIDKTHYIHLEHNNTGANYSPAYINTIRKEK